MKTLDRRQTPASGGRSLLRNERGMLLAVTMVILLVLSTLAAASLVNSFLERSLARNQVNATIAQNAADAGIAAGLAWLNDPATSGGIADPATTPGWTTTFSGSLANVGTSTASGVGSYNAKGPTAANYTTTLRFRREGDADAPSKCDLDGCGNNEVVLYNRCGAPADNCWSFPQSAYASPEGFPVIVIRSQGTYGEGGIRVIEMEVARDKFDVQATGAVTAASNVEATGSITIDGRAHYLDGTLDDRAMPPRTCADLPGSSVPLPLCTDVPGCDQNGDGRCNCTDGFEPNSGANCNAGGHGTLDLYCYRTSDDGSATLDGSVPWAADGATPPLSPDQALGLDEGDLALKLGGEPAAGASVTKGNITWHNQDISLPANDLGILVVHNPLFESLKWSWSDTGGENFKYTLLTKTCAERKAVVAGVADYPSYDPKLDSTCPDYDAAYKTARTPRNVEQHGSTTFKGVIIADKVDQINGTADIIGALISLSSVTVTRLGAGNANILWSCDAINFYTDVGFSIKLSWHRVR